MSVAPPYTVVQTAPVPPCAIGIIPITPPSSSFPISIAAPASMLAFEIGASEITGFTGSRSDVIGAVPDTVSTVPLPPPLEGLKLIR